MLISAIALYGCNQRNSDEACNHQVTMDLDSGNYDAVLASSCADPMQRGAAYFGKAGFDAVAVINAMSRTSSGPTSTTGPSNLNIYMNTLVKDVTSAALADLDYSSLQYQSIPMGSAFYLDAQFDIGIVDTMKSLSLLKSILNTTGAGTVSSACDRNDNGKPDAIDAAACALLISAGNTISSCASSMTLTEDVPDMIVSELGATLTGTYRGMIFQVDGAGLNTAGCPSPNVYKQLLYWSTSGTPTWAPAATSLSSTCTGTPGGDTWPCPIIRNNQPLDLVTAIDTSLNSALTALGTSLTGTSDVRSSIENIRSAACGTSTCTAAELAGYLQTY